MAPVVACPVDTIGSNPTGSENSPKVTVPPTCGGTDAVVAVDCEPFGLLELEQDAATRQNEASTAQAPTNLVSRRLIAIPLAWSCTHVRHHAHTGDGPSAAYAFPSLHATHPFDAFGPAPERGIPCAA